MGAWESPCVNTSCTRSRLRREPGRAPLPPLQMHPRPVGDDRAQPPESVGSAGLSPGSAVRSVRSRPRPAAGSLRQCPWCWCVPARPQGLAGLSALLQRYRSPSYASVSARSADGVDERWPRYYPTVKTWPRAKPGPSQPGLREEPAPQHSDFHRRRGCGRRRQPPRPAGPGVPPPRPAPRALTAGIRQHKARLFTSLIAGV